MDAFPQPDAPVLFLDTGVGGLSVLGPARTLLPQAPIVYAADYAGMPYGTKSEAEVAARVPAILGRLVERYRPRLAVIACNTASTIALGHVRSALDLPVVGTVPAVKPAAAMTRTGVIGLLGTQATIRQPYVDRLHAEFGAGTSLIRHGAPDLVNAAEAKLRGAPVDMAIIRDAVRGMTSQPGGEKIDTVILACTHFPLVAEELDTAFGDQQVRFIDGSAGIARRIAYLTEGQPWPTETVPGIFVTSGDLAPIAPYRAALEQYGLTRFESLRG